MGSTRDLLAATPLARATSLWDEAVGKLPQTDRLLFLGDSRLPDNKIQILQDILAITEAKRDICIKKRWKYKKKNGDVVVIRDQLDKVTTWIQRFKDVGSTIVQYDPVHAALPWAGVLLILRCITDDAQTMGAMVDGIEKVASLLPRYSVLEQMYYQTATPITSGAEQLKVSLVKMYTSILRYLVAARRYFEKNTVKRTLKAVLGTLEAETQRYLDVISKRAADVDSCLLLVQSESSHIASDKTTDMWQSLADLTKPIMRSSAQIAELYRQLSVQERRRVMAWLSTTRSSLHHRSEGENFLPGTGAWLLRNQEYLRWRDSSSSAILWLHGIPGCGKTKLIYKLVQTHLQEALSVTNPAPLAYFYCTRNPAEPERSNPTEILRNLLKQLAVTRRGDLKDKVLEEFQRRDGEAQLEGCADPAPLTLAESTNLIKTLLQEDPATIIIDAMDECDPGERHRLLDALEEILGESASLVKILVSSRDEGDISCHLRSIPNVYIRADDNSHDINHFIDYSVSKAISSGRLLNGNLSEATKDKVLETLKTGSHGMFRWAAMQIDNLCDHRRVKIENDLLEELGSLPVTLRESYNRSCQRVWGLARPSRMIADRVFKWLLCAQKLMTIDDLSAVVAVESESHTLSVDRILDICSSLVVVDDRGHFRFAHLSVREYLEVLDEFSAARCHRVVLQRCLEAYINIPVNSPADWSSPSYSDKDIQLQQYAMLFWPHHCQGVGDPTLDETLDKITSEFLFAANSLDQQTLQLSLAGQHDSPFFSQPLADWLADIRNATRYTGLGEFDGALLERLESALSPSYTPEFLACTFDLVWILRSMENRGWADWGQLNPSEQSCLSVAVRWNAMNAVQWLLDGPRVPTESLTDALSLAINLAKLDIAASLIQRGANGFACLDAAISTGDCHVVGLILDQKQNFDAYVFGKGAIRAYRDWRTQLFPLFWDVFTKMSGPDAVRVFLMVSENRHTLRSDLGAAESDQGLYQRVLGHMRACGSEEAAAVLGLSNLLGEDFDELGVLEDGSLAFRGVGIWRSFENELFDDYVFRSHFVDILRILLILDGEEVRSKQVLHDFFYEHDDDDEQSPDDIPANWRWQDVILLLFCMRLRRFESVETATVKVLLDHGADVNVGYVDSKGRRPLMFAAKSHRDGSLSLLELLIEGGADLDQTDRKGQTALMHALKTENYAGAKLLIQKGCDVNCVTRDGEAALTLAWRKCRHDMIELLRRHGARLPRPLMNGSVAMPLLAALTQRCMGCFRALLTPGPGDLDRPSGLQDVVDIITDRLEPDPDDEDHSAVEPTEPNDGTTAPGSPTARRLGKLERLRQVELLPNANSWEDGLTPLQVAICYGEIEIIRYFLDTLVVDVNATDHNGFSALHYVVTASSRADPIIIDLLLSKGADPCVQDNNGCIPLHLTSKIGWSLDQDSYTERLLRAMPPSGVDIANRDGNTALHVAVMHRSQETIPLLLMAGADPCAENSQNQSCIQLALAMGIRVSDFFTDYYLDVFSDAHCFLFQQEDASDAMFHDGEDGELGLPLLSGDGGFAGPAATTVVQCAPDGGGVVSNEVWRELVASVGSAKDEVVALEPDLQWKRKWRSVSSDYYKPVTDVDLFGAYGEAGWSAVDAGSSRSSLPLRPVDSIYWERGC